jgi:uncharacterized protein
MPVDKKNFSFDLKSLTEQGVFTGYASTFGNVDQYNDRMVKGAFKRTINSSKGVVPILLQHQDPIGTGLTLREDNTGLFIKGELFLNDEFPEAKKAYTLVQKGLIKAMSIGYRTIRHRIVSEGKELIRELLEVKLYEVSLVLFPVNEDALLTDMKSEDITTVRNVLTQYPQHQWKEMLEIVQQPEDDPDSSSPLDTTDLTTRMQEIAQKMRRHQ